MWQTNTTIQFGGICLSSSIIFPDQNATTRGYLPGYFFVYCIYHIFMELVHICVDHTALSNSHYPIMLQNGNGKGCYHPELHDLENLTGWKWIRGGLFWGATQQNKIFTSDASWILNFTVTPFKTGVCTLYLYIIYIYTWNPNDPCFNYTRPCFWGSNPQKQRTNGFQVQKILKVHMWA